MKACKRCGAALGVWALTGAVAERAGDLVDWDRDEPSKGRVRCRCGAVHRHVAATALAIVAVAAALASIALLLWAVAGPFDRHLDGLDPYWQGAALLAVFTAPLLPVWFLLACVWPVESVAQGDPGGRRSRAEAALYFEYALALAMGAAAIAFTQGFGPLCAFVLVTALACFWKSGR